MNYKENSKTIHSGDYICYTLHYELGKIKRIPDDEGVFAWFHTGDTAASISPDLFECVLSATQAEEMTKEEIINHLKAFQFSNDYAVESIVMKSILISANVWKVMGYAGYYDDDGDSDNINKEVVMDISLDKNDVLKFFMDKYSRTNRSVSLNATLVGKIYVNDENKDGRFEDRKQVFCENCQDDVYYKINRKTKQRFCLRCGNSIREINNKKQENNYEM